MDNTSSDLKVVAWNVRGMCNKEKQKEIKRFLAKSKFSICALLETHIKENKMKKICVYVYGNWYWISNIQHSTRGCRIIVGWNANEVNVMPVHTTNQAMLCAVETVDHQHRFFCCFIYATNFGKDRKSLWKTLECYRNIVCKDPWILMGDWNVSLNVGDHSAGGSCKTADMVDFQECIEAIEVEDLNYSGCHFTRVQSRLNPTNGILKKIDRIMGSSEFMDDFPSAHANFLPHFTSDHCPGVLTIPNTVKGKRKAFRFANFVSNYPEFLQIVEKEWQSPINGCAMYKLVKKLKVLKYHMKNLSGNMETFI